jgi:hypothetical protein
MSDAVTSVRPVRAQMPASPARRLSRQVAVLGARLATLLDGVAPGRDDGLDSARGFLRSMADRHAFTTASDLRHPRHGAAADPIDRLAAAAGPVDRLAAAAEPIDRLAAGLGLGTLDVELVLLAAMPEEHEGYASVMRALNPRSEGRVTVGLAAQLLCDSDRGDFREQLLSSPALRTGLLVLTGDGSLFEQNLVLAAGLWPVLGGIDCWPADLSPLAIGTSLAGLDEWLALAPVRRGGQMLTRNDARLLVITADSEAVAVDRAGALCAQAGLAALAFDGAGLAGGRDRLARLHALARGAVPVLRLAAADGGEPPPLPPGDGFPGAVIVCARRGAAVAAGDQPMICLDAQPLSAAARERLWRQVLPELDGQAATLAMRYPVEPAAAQRIAQDLRAAAALDGRPIDLDRVADGVRARASVHLTPGLNVVRPAAGWTQLVLPAPRKALLAEALQRLQLQTLVLDRWQFLAGRPGARGVRVLLCGPPGTGKTLSAEVLAHELGVDLLVVDIARLVSKWIGETEKHLAAVFDAAEHSQAVLLFDEADALFGRRTEVSDAHDRYANLETAYLLSRLERFEGLVMLSTNLKQNIDNAFLRRLEFVIEFEPPGVDEREALWRCHLPPTAPLAPDVDLRQLAALYPITGGLIRNAAVAAAFLAAAAGSPIGRPHLIAAIAREYDKSGKAFPGAPAGVTRS